MLPERWRHPALPPNNPSKDFKSRVSRASLFLGKFIIAYTIIGLLDNYFGQTPGNQLGTQGHLGRRSRGTRCKDTQRFVENKINLIMLLGKSPSLPEIRVNLQKYDHFFSRHSRGKELAMEEERNEALDPKTEPKSRTRHSSHRRNLDFIEKKSTLRSKVDSYLTNSSKVGILDHAKHEHSNRQSLSKIVVQSTKPAKTEAEQQLGFITKLKSELDFYFERNRRMESSIKNGRALTTQVREKVAYFQQLLAPSWAEQATLLAQREQDLVLVRYEADRLKFMLGRLKEGSILTKKRVKDAQAKLKGSAAEIAKLSEMENTEQSELDNKQYLLQQYEQYEGRKTDEMHIKTQSVAKNMEEIEASRAVKQIQEGLPIMERGDYQNEVNSKLSHKLRNQLASHQFYSKLLESEHSKSIHHYEGYEKAEKLIKMHRRDRDSQVQDSYRQSFEVRDELELKIRQKEAQLRAVGDRNRQLRQEYTLGHFQEVEGVEHKLGQLALELRTDATLKHEAEQKEQTQFGREVVQREKDILRCQQLLVRLKHWIIKQEQNLNIFISKTFGLAEHLKALIDSVGKELKKREPSFSVAQLVVRSNVDAKQKVSVSNKKKK